MVLFTRPLRFIFHHLDSTELMPGCCLWTGAPPLTFLLHNKLSLCYFPVDILESFHFLGTIITQDFGKYSRGCTYCGSWSSSAHQRQWWCTFTPPSLSPSSSPLSPSGSQQTADYSISFGLLRRWLQFAIPPGPWGEKERLWQAHLRNTPHWQKAAVQQDQNLTPFSF